MTAAPDWSGASGDIWARRWRDTDRALAAVGAALDRAIAEAAPAVPFRALDVGCGPGTTSLALAAARPDASILGCDLSEPLVAIASQRGEGLANVRFIAEDAEAAAPSNGPFDVIFSRHGVMFFEDPNRAFRTLRGAANLGARLVFSCFRAWENNPWAAELAAAAAGKPTPPPGREPSGFAFADPDYVHDILAGAGWGDGEGMPLDFDYVAGEPPDAIGQALDFLVELGPAARVIETLDPDARGAAVDRVRAAASRYERGGHVVFPAAAWLWSATAR